MFRYRVKQEDDREVIEALKEHSRSYRREGICINHKKVERLWSTHGLTVPVRRRQRRRGKGLESALGGLRALYPNQVWVYDPVEDGCINRRKLRILTVVDELTRESLETYVDESIPATKVIEMLGFLFLLHGYPACVRSDNGPEFIAQAIREKMEGYRLPGGRSRRSHSSRYSLVQCWQIH